jgi:predicted CXXCH cytochrome family protein
MNNVKWSAWGVGRIAYNLIFLVLCFTPPCLASSIVNSKHNLSLSGPGNVKASSESEICIFCHTPHNASTQAPLWNRYDSGQVYIPYTSTTLKARPGQPTGASKLCLSCHDGTIALGSVRSRSQPIQFIQTLSGEDNLGTDLSDDHPISFRYDSALASSNPQLKDPSGLTASIRLDQDSQLQCTSCHDPHNDQFGYFLRVDSIRGNLCLSCHNMNGWDDVSMHKNSASVWNGASTNPWKRTQWNNVSRNACQNCHALHNAGGKKRLLNYSNEEDNCLVCHNGNVGHLQFFRLA